MPKKLLDTLLGNSCKISTREPSEPEPRVRWIDCSSGKIEMWCPFNFLLKYDGGRVILLCLGYLEGFHSKYSESWFIYTKNVPGTNLRRNYKLSLPLASRNLYVNKRSNWLRWDNCFFLQFYWYIVELLFITVLGLRGFLLSWQSLSIKNSKLRFYTILFLKLCPGWPDCGNNMSLPMPLKRS